MTPQEAIPIIKAVNRRERKARRSSTATGITHGWDYVTWRAVYPRVSKVYQEACEAYTGRTGRFVPNG